MFKQSPPPLPSAVRARFRLAPTPSGYLHEGNAFSFVLTWVLARVLHARLLLRIDDLDADRKRPEYVRDIFETLEWLGLDYDEGPRSVEEFEEGWSQRFRLPAYDEALRRLERSGFVFACSCSRAAIAAVSSTGAYPGTCRDKRLPTDTPETALRLVVADSETVAVRDERRGMARVPVGRILGAFVVRRKDGIPAYHIASLCDDDTYGVTHIVRGEDLLPSTATQILLAERLGFTAFKELSFLHHPLRTAPGGGKLSKSAGAVSLKSWRQEGKSPASIYRAVAEYLRLEPEAYRSPDVLLQALQNAPFP